MRAAISPDAVMEFARHAGVHGWTRRALRDFPELEGSSPRDVAWALNDIADSEMCRRFQGKLGVSWNELIRYRFIQNAPLKASVMRLARSDIWHPVDTLARTDKTARAMQACGAPGGAIKRSLMVLVYSTCVLVWLVDRTPSQHLTSRAVRLFARW
jgi:hypothetical protein